MTMRMLLKMACLLALWVTPLVATAGPCRLIDPSTCPRTSDLVRASGFAQALGHFTGDGKASYFKSDKSISSQALDGLQGPAQNAVPLADQRYLFAACPSRDCGGSAVAVILNEYGQIEGLAFSSFHCDDICDNRRYLDIYMRKDGQDATVLSALKQWATGDELRKTLWHPEADNGLDQRMDVHLLP